MLLEVRAAAFRLRRTVGVTDVGSLQNGDLMASGTPAAVSAAAAAAAVAAAAAAAVAADDDAAAADH